MTYLGLRWQITALHVAVRLERLRLVLRAYDPSQARVPAGSPDDGQWTDGDTDSPGTPSDDARIIAIADNDRYRVQLEEEEKRGHTLSRHVGRTDDQMLQRVRDGAWRTLLNSGGPRRDGSFASRKTANDLVNQVLERNSRVVDEVAIGQRCEAFFKESFEHQTGREAYSQENGVVYLRNTYGFGVLIRHDPGSSRGYRVYTAYPRTEGD